MSSAKAMGDDKAVRWQANGEHTEEGVNGDGEE